MLPLLLLIFNTTLQKHKNAFLTDLLILRTLQNRLLFINRNRKMDLFRDQLDKQSSGIFDAQDECAKVTTEIFDKTLPSELEFDDTASPQSQSQNLKEIENSVFNNLQISDEINQEEKLEIKQPQRKRQPSDYEILTKSILNFTFKKRDQSIILRQPQHSVGSFIPFELKIKTFRVKFQDELSELSKGIPTYKLFWKRVVGYLKVDLYIKNGFIYLLEEKKEGWLVHSIWDLQNLFKIFSDRQENTLRIVFREIQKNEVKLVAKELKTQDLNLLAHIFQEANQLQIVSDS